MSGSDDNKMRMRIHIGERDKFDGKPLYQAIVDLLRSRRYAGATVLRGIMGFGAGAHVHSDRFLELSMDLPLVIECVESAENIEAVMPELEAMLEGGLITVDPTRVLLQRGGRRKSKGRET